MDTQLLFDAGVTAALVIIGIGQYVNLRDYMRTKKMFILHLMGDPDFEDSVKRTNNKFKNTFAKHGIKITNLD